MWNETRTLLTDNASNLALALVAPLGTDLEGIVDAIRERLSAYAYTVRELRLSEAVRKLNESHEKELELAESPPVKRLQTYMDGANYLRKKYGNEVLAAWNIVAKCSEPQAATAQRQAWVFRSLKHPDEVHLLRAVYGEGLFVIGVSVSHQARNAYFQKNNIPSEAADQLIKRDAAERDKFGQHTTEAYELADVFVRQASIHDDLNRFFRLVFASPDITPTRMEYAMFMAYAASLRSGDLSRQVGAVVWHDNAGIISTGCNDVPRAHGGLYWAEDKLDERDIVRGFDPNEQERNVLSKEISDGVKVALGLTNREDIAKVQSVCDNSRLRSITEFGRTVHAEMDALLTCLRNGISPLGATLFCTTFPCHNCARHIIAAGITCVVYVEPYPKSRAIELHSDAIELNDDAAKHKVRFIPFAGIGPRRYVDLFALKWSSGRALERKKDGKVIGFKPSDASLRMPMKPEIYGAREKTIVELLENKLNTKNQRSKS